MRRTFTVLILGLTWFSSLAQITFEQGYFVDNDNNKIEGLIKNVDWKNNPTNFEYRKSEQSEAITINIAQAREFGINNIAKYVRANVKIDRSGHKLSELSWNRDPAWSEEQL